MKNSSSDSALHSPPHQPEIPTCDWDFNLSAVISSSASSAASDAIGVVEFDHTNSFLATGGIARRIRIYNAQKFLSRENDNDGAAGALDHTAACEFYMCTPAKLSSLKWKPGSGSRVIGSGDYDGVVMEYDLEKRVPVFERDEHGGRRVWSIDYSNWDPTLGASGSDDGTMQMWDTRCDAGGKFLASVRPNRVACSPVCCVEFNPFGGVIVAVGCADRKIYGYDARRMVEPVFVLDGHEKAVSYARFLDLHTIVSSSIDGSLMMWHAEDRRLIRRYRGHLNTRRFVGLSVWRSGGLLSCGSENNRLFVYDKRWGDPIWVSGFDQDHQPPPPDQGFVSGVCWRQTGEESCTLVAGGSDGVLRVFQGQRKS
ncbi:Transducin/WD40 repeat-like superfamily protein [Perilla frutescens var. hirtella]|uniref:Transducin/WD40 repeat-like superfamily protein n=1 Tax=Perilla frutescens var. hirtella TaxID=608512 RepID=A0AAD4J6H5_PERFH|nr:Transducin/WD40 repeat-like superfamily protein [Perilla frutescens var. hirtella]